MGYADSANSATGGVVGAKAAPVSDGSAVGQLDMPKVVVQGFRHTMAEFADNNRGVFGYWGWAAGLVDRYIPRPDSNSVEGKVGKVGAVVAAMMTPGGARGKTAEAVEALAKGELKLLHMNPRNLIPTQTAEEMTGSVIKRLEKDMRANGFDASQPISGVVRADGRVEISDGHHRAQAAIRAGLTEVPVEVYRP